LPLKHLYSEDFYSKQIHDEYSFSVVTSETNQQMFSGPIYMTKCDDLRQFIFYF